jgi:hypothetical protein
MISFILKNATKQRGDHFDNLISKISQQSNVFLKIKL